MKAIAILYSYSIAFLTLLTSSVLDSTAQFLSLDIVWSLVKGTESDQKKPHFLFMSLGRGPVRIIYLKLLIQRDVCLTICT